MLPVLPMMIAAVIGPSPQMSVSDVPDALTAAVMRRFEVFNRPVSSSIPSVKSWAISRRWRPIESTGVNVSSERVDPGHRGHLEVGAAGEHLQQQRVQPAALAVLRPADVAMALAPTAAGCGCGRRATLRPDQFARSAAIATERASLGSFFCDRPVLNVRTLEARTAGTSITVSPAAISCWASR